MTENFTLWLDESGDFLNQKNLKARNMQGSLVGGLLFRETDSGRIVEALSAGEILSDIDNHAMNMGVDEKVGYVIPILTILREEYKAVEVLFENQEYEEGERGNQSESLYLRIISEGLIRLLSHLNAIYESVHIDVLIAHRVDGGINPIDMGKYELMLSNIIEIKRRNGNIRISEDSSVRISIGYANEDKRLQLADFVCNTRLVRDAIKKFDSNARIILDGIYDDPESAIIFSLTENNTDAVINRMLAGMNIADAVIEFYSFRKNLPKPRNTLNRIIKKISNTNYRIQKSQIKTLSGKITSIVERISNYELSEEYLLTIANDFIPRLKETGAPYIHLGFNIQLMLSDCYLREGDTPRAHLAIERCAEILDESDYSMEELFLYYQLKEKEALLAIDEFDFEKGQSIMAETGTFINNMMKTIGSEDVLKNKFKNIRSEYYGDVLCMQLLAMMSLQRENPDIYEHMVRLSDEALIQYPGNEAELERHRQYRAYIESEHGNCREGLRWLALSKCIELGGYDEKDIAKLLKQICSSEINIGCQWYLMYYLLILEKASDVDKSLAAEMFKALLRNRKMLESAGIDKDQDDGRSRRVNLTAIKYKKAPFEYHPIEIIFWKYGHCIMVGKSDTRNALRYMKRALDVCFPETQTGYRDKNGYLALNIKGLAINAEFLSILYHHDKKAFGYEYKKMMRRTDTILKDKNVSEAARELVWRIKNMIMDSKNDDGSYNDVKMMTASSLIPF